MQWEIDPGDEIDGDCVVGGAITLTSHSGTGGHADANTLRSRISQPCLDATASQLHSAPDAVTILLRTPRRQAQSPDFCKLKLAISRLNHFTSRDMSLGTYHA